MPSTTTQPVAHDQRVAQQRRDSYHKSGLLNKIIGDPVESEKQDHARLPKWVALPVFASDALSSVAYASQEILLALGGAGLWVAAQNELYTRLTLGITFAILVLLAIVATSYRQTIFAYPQGGGSYRVSRENLGATWGLIAGGALLIDYVLTVAVSVSAGVKNLLDTPLFSILEGSQHKTLFAVVACCVVIMSISVANLRGLKESGALFAPPTYGFIFMTLTTVALGVFAPLLGWTLHPDQSTQVWEGHLTEAADFSRMAMVVLVLKAFANGCSAMTGVEAVSDGVPAFRKPESRNASQTLMMMAVLLGTMFLGISWLATHFHVVYWPAYVGVDGHIHECKSVIEQLSAIVYGRPVHGDPVSARTVLYYAMTFSTAAILLLAANTSFADFPRLASNMARDNYLPRYLTVLGDKLAYTYGVVLLGFFSCLLIVLMQGNTDRLIPLYAVGVFTAFTLSQSGMVALWLRTRTPGWKGRALINGLGAGTTFVVLLDVAIEKFTEGAWLVIVLIPLLVTLFRVIEKHYREFAAALSLEPAGSRPPASNTVLVLVPAMHRGVLKALDYARSLSPDCRALHVDLNSDAAAVDHLERQWEERVGDDVPLVVLESPFRSLNAPVLSYLQEVRDDRESRLHHVTVVIPEFNTSTLLAKYLHSQSASLLKAELGRLDDVVVCNVRFSID